MCCRRSITQISLASARTCRRRLVRRAKFLGAGTASDDPLRDILQYERPPVVVYHVRASESGLRDHQRCYCFG